MLDSMFLLRCSSSQRALSNLAQARLAQKEEAYFAACRYL